VVVVVTPEGIVRTLYHEEWALAALGLLHIERASHVEPTPEGQWLAQIIDGPVLGPFPTRSAALAAEVDWLSRERLSFPPQARSINGRREECGSGVVGDLSHLPDPAEDG
jgi:hypothetical protein